MKHINVYGPAASGKTRNAEALKRKYGCVQVVDEGKYPANASLVGLARAAGNGRVLVLSQEPVRGMEQIHITEALR